MKRAAPSSKRCSSIADKCGAGAVGKPTFDASQYNTWVESYASREKAFEALGCKQFCRSHAARAVKKNGCITHLRCRLRSSNPPCLWAATLCQHADASVDMYQHATEWKEHGEKSASAGTRGFADMKERESLVSLLSSTATQRPTSALRTARLAQNSPVKKAQLKQVQNLKRAVVRQHFASRTLGQLRRALGKHQAIPAHRTKGYYCYSACSSSGLGKKPKVTVVATTRTLQERWVTSPECTAAADGGFKFNLLGWPLHVIGLVNAAGNFAPCALGLTSSMEGEHVGDTLVASRAGPHASRKGLRARQTRCQTPSSLTAMV